jgi:hypothetical protein
LLKFHELLGIECKLLIIYLFLLQAHIVGGFSQSFNSGEICRLCHLQYDDLPDLSGIPSAEEWTSTHYDSVCDLLESAAENQKLPLKGRCVFNILESFHAVGQMPLDAMHDWLEKIASTDGQSVVVAFISDKKITLEEYNCGLLNIKLTDYETGDQVLPLKNGADKIPGTRWIRKQTEMIK